MALVQQWLYGFAVASGLETFAALQALSENASCKFTPAVRTVSPVFFGHKKQPRKPAPKPPNVQFGRLCRLFRADGALRTAQSQHTRVKVELHGQTRASARALSGQSTTPQACTPLPGEHLRRTFCIGNEGRSENARSLRPRRTQIVSGRIPRARALNATPAPRTRRPQPSSSQEHCAHRRGQHRPSSARDPPTRWRRPSTSRPC